MDATAIASIADMVRDAERHADQLKENRERATEYYRGEMKDTPADQGRSSLTTRDVRAQIKKVLPSIMRTLMGSAALVEYQPIEQGDEEGADQASDYVNWVVAPETNIHRQIEDALHDALLLRNGILTWFWEEKTTINISSHTGLTDDGLAELVNDDSVEVLAHSENVEQIDTPEGPMPIVVHDVEIKRSKTQANIRVDAVPREQFLIHPDATTIEDAPIAGRCVPLTRSDLVAMGYDRDVVDGLPVSDDDGEDDVRREDAVTDSDEPHKPNEPIDFYDIYVRFDADGDGIAELHHMHFAGGLGEKNMLLDEYCDEIQICDVKVMAQPHQWEGISLADDLMDIQRAKTVLLRETLDNIYWQNKAQPVVQDGAVINPDAVLNPEFGKPIRVRQGTDARAAVAFNQVPFVAQQSFGMMSYLDEEATDRTGVSDASSGLAPDALQNMTAKASAMIEQAGIGQTELMVKTAAVGLRRLFRGILRLIIKHQDVPRTVRLRGNWVQFDPRHWNADMDCAVNTGLGAGTRERDMQMMQVILGLQEKLLASFGAANNPYVKPDDLWNSISKLVEAAGLKDPDLYFTQPDPQEIQAMLQAQASKPDPEMQKVQAQMQLEQAKTQAKIDGEKAKMAVQRDKEKAQMEADLVTANAQREADMQKEAQRLQFEREKLMRQESMQAAQMAQQRELELLKLGLSQRDDGAVVSKEDERYEGFTRHVAQIMATLADVTKRANSPRRVIRDENGDVIGMETADGDRQQVIRDENGDVVGVGASEHGVMN